MSTPEKRLEPLAPDLARLLDAARAPVPLSEQALSRMEHRLGLAVAVSAGALGVASKGVGAAALAKLVAFFSRKVPLGLSALTVGIGIGAGAHALAVREAVTRNVEQPVVLLTQSPRVENTNAHAPTTAPMVAASDLPLAPSAAVAVPPRTDDTQGNAAAPSNLAEERAILEMGRTALARGDHAAALSAVQKHERSFSSGRLREEREFLAIQALVGLGRQREAQSRAARFLNAYPRSMFAPAVRGVAPSTEP